VAMDVKAPPRLYAKLAGVDIEWGVIEESIRVLAASDVPHQFRTTVVEAFLSEEDLEEIASLLPAGDRLVRQEFRLDLARDPLLRTAAVAKIKNPRRIEHVHSA